MKMKKRLSCFLQCIARSCILFAQNGRGEGGSRYSQRDTIKFQSGEEKKIYVYIYCSNGRISKYQKSVKTHDPRKFASFN